MLSTRQRNTLIKPSEKDGFMEKMGQVMSDPEFKYFFREYFQDWSDVQAAIMLMKTYAFVDEEYTKRTGQKLATQEIVSIVKKMICNTECRRLIMDEMTQFMEKKGKFMDFYTQAIEEMPTISIQEEK